MQGRFKRSLGIEAMAALTFAATFAGAAAAQAPSNYPAEYAKIVEAAEAEGSVVIDANTEHAAVEPILPDFRKAFPKIRADYFEIKAADLFGPVIVTDDQIETLAIADKIVLLNGGVIAQEGTSEDLYSRPKTLFTAAFIGNNVRLAGKVVAIDEGFATQDCDGLQVTGRQGPEQSVGQATTAICRLDRLSLGRQGDLDCVQMQRTTSMFLGEKRENVYRLHNHSLRVLTDGPISESASLIRIPRETVWVF